MITFKRLVSLALCFLIAVSLAACDAKKTPGSTLNTLNSPSLPLQEQNAPKAPYGDSHASEVYRASIYYASSDGAVSMPSTRVLWLNSDTPLERRLAEETLKSPGGDAVSVAPKGSKIISVEAAGPIVNVNIQPSAPLTDTEISILMEAMSKTLMELEHVEGVGFLISGRAASLSSLPAGLITKDTSFRTLMDENARLLQDNSASVSRKAALYFPSLDESCLLVESAPITLNADDPASSLLLALAKAPKTAGAAVAIPMYDALIAKKSQVSLTASGDQILSVYLDASALSALNESGHDRNLYLASIVLTLTSFLPEIDGVSLEIGGKLVTEVPVKDGETRKFASGIMKRSDFTHLIGKNVTLYFANESGMLQSEIRAMPISFADSPRALIRALMEGPRNASLLPVFPDGVKETDILGVRISSNAANVNLSSNVYRLAQSFTDTEEELFVFSLVNTLSNLRNVSGIRLYFDGETGSVLTRNVYLEGIILKNPGRISEP